MVLSVGRPLGNDLSAFEVRQAVKELETANFSRTVESQGNIFDLARLSVENEVIRRAQKTAKQLSSILHPYHVIALDKGFNTEEELQINRACALLGKVVCNRGSYASLSSVDVEYTISRNDLSDLTVSQEIGKIYISKYSTNDKLAVFNSEVGSFSLSHLNMMAYYMALRQLFDLGPNSAVYTEYDLSHPIGYFLKVWSPALSGSCVVKDGYINDATVLVGNAKFVNEFYLEFPNNNLGTIVLLDKDVSKLKQSVDREIVFNGLLSKSICPVLTLNSPNFEGKSLEGKTIKQLGKDLNTHGRPLPGISIKVTDDNNNTLPPNRVGHILAKGCFFSRSGWVNSGIKGSMTEEGFLIA